MRAKSTYWERTFSRRPRRHTIVASHFLSSVTAHQNTISWQLGSWARNCIGEKTFNAQSSTLHVPWRIDNGNPQAQGHRLGAGVDGSRRATATEDRRSCRHYVKARGSSDPHGEGIRARITLQSPDASR